MNTDSPTLVKFLLLHPDAKLPTRATEHAACFDVVAVSREIKDGYVKYGLGFATEIPVGWQAKFYARSSISDTDLVLCNAVGVIDADYRGEWQARFKLALSVVGYVTFQQRAYATTTSALSHLYRLYEVGDRIGQIQFEPVPALELQQVAELSTTARGTGGFGSTGV